MTQHRTHKNKKSGLPAGVYPLDSTVNPYWATICIDGKRTYLGSYPSIELAERAYLQAMYQHHIKSAAIIARRLKKP